jgi:hypothetical protein
MVAAISACYANFYEKRSVLVAANPPEFDAFSGKRPSPDWKVHVSTAFSNDGNHTETISGGKLGDSVIPVWRDEFRTATWTVYPEGR